MTDAGRAGRMPELGQRVENLTQNWKGPMRKAAVEYAIARASKGTISEASRKRISDILNEALDREAGGAAAPPAIDRVEAELGNVTPRAALQNVLTGIAGLSAKVDEQFAIRALRIFFVVPRAMKKALPSGTQIRERHEASFRAMKALLAAIPPGSLPIRFGFGPGGILNRSPRGMIHRDVNVNALTPAQVALFQAFFNTLPASVRDPATGQPREPMLGNFYQQLGGYDAGPRVKRVIKALGKRTDELKKGKKETPAETTARATAAPAAGQPARPEMPAVPARPEQPAALPPRPAAPPQPEGPTPADVQREIDELLKKL